MHAAWVRFATDGDPGWEPWDDRHPVRVFGDSAPEAGDGPAHTAYGPRDSPSGRSTPSRLLLRSPLPWRSRPAARPRALRSCGRPYAGSAGPGPFGGTVEPRSAAARERPGHVAPSSALP